MCVSCRRSGFTAALVTASRGVTKCVTRQRTREWSVVRASVTCCSWQRTDLCDFLQKLMLFTVILWSRIYGKAHLSEGERERERKEGNVLFNDALNTFYLQLYGVRHIVKDHSDSERGNQLPPHRLLFPISSKGSFICIIPQTGLHIPRPLLHQS